MRTRLENYFKAGFPAIAIQTAEEARVLADVIDAAKALKKNLVVWSITDGMQQVLPAPKNIPDTEDPIAAVKQRLEDTVYIFRDIETIPLERDPMLTRALKDLFNWAKSVGSCAVFVGVQFKPQPSFEKFVVVTDYTLPDKLALKKVAEGINKGLNKKAEINEEVLRSLSGLTTHESENALALAYIETGKFDPEVIYREKVQAVKRSGLLEIIDPDPLGLDSIGGLENLKDWILKRRRAFTPEAEKFGLPAPKGFLVVGVPGTGKSKSAKAIGTALGVPTIKLDVGALFNSLVGESEARTRDALKLAEAMSPCVLWIDEIEKGFAGSSGGGANDSGVTRRVFGTVISWMQERRRPVFLVATANEVESLPPEFLRKGRFDEIFTIDLPTEEERKAIFSIHIARKGRDVKKFDLGKLAAATKEFTGAEIEAVLDAALFEAFERGEEVTVNDIVAAAGSTVPLAKTASEKIQSIRDWGNGRARAASRVEVPLKALARKINAN